MRTAYALNGIHTMTQVQAFAPNQLVRLYDDKFSQIEQFHIVSLSFFLAIYVGFSSSVALCVFVNAENRIREIQSHKATKIFFMCSAV